MKVRMLIVIAAALFAAASAWSQAARAVGLDDLDGAHRELARYKASEALRLGNRLEAQRRAESKGVQPKQAIDIQHYDIALEVDPGERQIEGEVAMTFVPTASLSKLALRLKKGFSAGEMTADGAPASVRRKGDDIVFSFSPPLAAGGSHQISLAYAGEPKLSGDFGGGMMFDEQGGYARATTLSEPFESYAWWPCVEDVTDKFTLDVQLTVPEGMVGASNGALISVARSENGWPTYHWREVYPICNYLVSVNVTNYARFSDTYASQDGSVQMPLDYFVCPEDLDRARINVRRVPAMVDYFAGLAGEYPFLSEKYGMVSFPWGGGMEHQTLTSMGDYYMGGSGNYDLIYAHELAHQWWGDEVTCGTWHDIWLNEGFATYFEVLWTCHYYGYDEGEDFARYYDDGSYTGYMASSVYVKDENRPFADTGAIYDKGGWVLHMLRRVMGDDAFFGALRDYREAHSMGSAVTEDFRSACEERYGASLKWFFDQWVYTPKRPIYSVSFSESGGVAQVTVTQKQKHKVKNRSTDRDVYIMPLDLTLDLEDGSHETTTVWNDQRVQTFSIPTSKKAISVSLDRDHWILKLVK